LTKSDKGTNVKIANMIHWL